jgi:diguanylate cyclase (GGDEF)-like protein
MLVIAGKGLMRSLGLFKAAIEWLVRTARRFDLRERHHRDAVIILAASAAVFAFSIWFDLFAKLYQFTTMYNSWELDELFMLSLVLSVGMIIFGYRRIQDLNREIVARRMAENAADNLARHDPLTGLPNRRSFTQDLETSLDDLIVSGQRAAVLLIDIRGFKAVNEIHGNSAGDRALVEIAQRMSNILDPAMRIARVGGDDFAIIQPHIHEIHDPTHFAHVVMEAIEGAAVAGDTDGSFGANIGIAIAPDDGTDAETLLRHANIALHRAKDFGRSNICFYAPEMNAYVERRGQIERALRGAIRKSAVTPHYQPLISLQDHRIIGFEALARWDTPEFGTVPPDVFIPIAEESELIHELGAQLLRQACRDAMTWPDDMILAFNLSPRQFREPTLGMHILGILAETGLSPHRLELEITESALVGDASAANKTIDHLRGAGVRIAIDDFGTGYATLSQLITLRFDKIKIDRSFVHRLGKDAESAVVVRAILGLAKGLGLTTTAEGIEDAAHLESLKATGCVEGQGYLFGKAIPANEIPALLDDGQQAKAAIG